ncbi:uncharacterized protein LOC128599542 isoform X5 [Ictalurus furcatus]|uniref:uncharacterized protein LOC128599542 isoform X5 n=1 Tax=Ictalurus furcatus TaxID=66913 RepID=UPI0023501E56|nr:uncharacterized protein LOC128599542 isoform X5 [Ictalurus furcatus]
MECVYQLKIVHDASSYIPKCCNQFFFEELLSVLTYSYQINELSLYTETKLLCAVLGEETMKTLYLFTLTLTGVLTQVSKYGVNYPDNQICAVRGFSVSIPCTYFYPTSNPNIQVTQMLWCSMNSNRDVCINPPYVYNSALNTTSDFEYAGDNKSDCTLLIHNVQFSYSGEYRFRFITDVTGGRWTGVPGPTLQVADLKVSLIRLSGNGTLKQGDSLNLTCDVNCTQSSSQFVWSKNNERLPESGPVLHFPAVTVRDSGNYTCTWKTNMTSGSETISLLVEGENQWTIWIIVLVIAGVIFISVTGAVIYNRRFLHTGQKKEDDSTIFANVQQQKEDNSNIYENVQQQKEDNSNIYENVQQQKDSFAIYANL